MQLIDTVEKTFLCRNVLLNLVVETPTHKVEYLNPGSAKKTMGKLFLWGHRLEASKIQMPFGEQMNKYSISIEEEQRTKNVELCLERPQA